MGKFWQQDPVDSKMDQCFAFHRLQYDSCYDEGDGTDDPRPVYRDGICQVDSGVCQPGTDCSDCPSDTACPGVGRERFAPCRLPGLECDQYVTQQFGSEHDLVDQCGIVPDLRTCADIECASASTESVVASVLYIDCPDVTIELGAAMGYLFVVQVSATAILVIVVVMASGGTFKSAWDQARSTIRTELATEDAESQELLQEHRTLGDPAATTKLDGDNR